MFFVISKVGKDPVSLQVRAALLAVLMQTSSLGSRSLCPQNLGLELQKALVELEILHSILQR